MSRGGAPGAEELRDAALRSLARREHSAHELRQKLVRRGGPEVEVDALIAALEEENLLSDRRFAEAFCRGRVGRGQGPVRIRHELRQHRIGESLIEEVMAPYREEWPRILEAARRHRFGAAAPGDYPEWAKQARFLQQRGFTSEQINRGLRKEF